MNKEFSIFLEQNKRYPILQLSGEITATSEELLRSHFEKIDSGDKVIVFDFKDTDYINSAGIAVLIGLITRSQEKDGQILFCRLSPHFQKVMDIVGLTDFVTIFDSLEDALDYNP